MVMREESVKKPAMILPVFLCWHHFFHVCSIIVTNENNIICHSRIVIDQLDPWILYLESRCNHSYFHYYICDRLYAGNYPYTKSPL